MPVPKWARGEAPGAKAHISCERLRGPFDFAQGTPLKPRSSTLLSAVSAGHLIVNY